MVRNYWLWFLIADCVKPHRGGFSRVTLPQMLLNSLSQWALSTLSVAIHTWAEWSFCIKLQSDRSHRSFVPSSKTASRITQRHPSLVRHVWWATVIWWVARQVRRVTRWQRCLHILYVRVCVSGRCTRSGSPCAVCARVCVCAGLVSATVRRKLEIVRNLCDYISVTILT